jgi:hypothetical protein
MVTEMMKTYSKVKGFEKFDIGTGSLFSNYGPGMWKINLGSWSHAQLKQIFESCLRGIEGLNIDPNKEYVTLVRGLYITNRYVNPNH